MIGLPQEEFLQAESKLLCTNSVQGLGQTTFLTIKAYDAKLESRPIFFKKRGHQSLISKLITKAKLYGAYINSERKESIYSANSIKKVEDPPAKVANQFQQLL